MPQKPDHRPAVTTTKASKTILVLSQVYVPDPTSVGQHMADAAAQMARRGYRVVALAARRGYDDPDHKYPLRELRDGVHVRRLPFSSLGKKTILLRLIGQMSFLIQCIVRGMFVRHLACVFISTSPPMCSFAAILIARVRRVPIKYWAMDINPDQIVALGTMSEGSLLVRLFNLLNRLILNQATDIVALDPFMADRLNRKVHISTKLHVMPPWPHEDHLEPVEHPDNPFRQEHGLNQKFVFMYSGNISPSHPVQTILDASKHFAKDPNLVILFIGGGLGRRSIEAFARREGLKQIRTLPYQPLDQLRFSLSAADVHLVSMGNEMVGIVHPCKVYGALTVGRPILLLGPQRSHIGQILNDHEIGWQVDHGDVAGAVKMIQRIREVNQTKLAEMSRCAREVILDRFSKQHLCREFCDVLERGLGEVEH